MSVGKRYFSSLEKCASIKPLKNDEKIQFSENKLFKQDLLNYENDSQSDEDEISINKNNQSYEYF